MHRHTTCTGAAAVEVCCSALRPLECAITVCLCCLQDGVLQLSAGLLSALSAWVKRAAAGKEERSQAESKLAASLLATFGQHGPAPAPGIAAGPVSARCDPEPELRLVAARPLVSVSAHSSWWQHMPAAAGRSADADMRLMLPHSMGFVTACTCCV